MIFIDVTTFLPCSRLIRSLFSFISTVVSLFLSHCIHLNLPRLLGVSLSLSNSLHPCPSSMATSCLSLCIFLLWSVCLSLSLSLSHTIHPSLPWLPAVSHSNPGGIPQRTRSQKNRDLVRTNWYAVRRGMSEFSNYGLNYLICLILLIKSQQTTMFNES